MKRLAAYTVALISGLMIWLLCIPTLSRRRGNDNVGGEALIPVMTLGLTAVYCHKDEFFGKD